jgi:hypothetical protein
MFFALVYPYLVNQRFWMAHWGDWVLQQFNFRIVGDMSQTKDIARIFGEEMLRPREHTDLSGYNTDPSAGKIVGFLSFLMPSFTFSVRFPSLLLVFFALEQIR